MFELLGILITHYAWLAAWLLSAGLAGLALQAVLLDFSASKSPWPNAELAVFFSISAGLALQIALLIVLAMAQQLNPFVVVLCGIALAAGSLWLLWLRPHCISGLLAVLRRPWREWLAILPVLLVIAAWLVRPIGTAAGSDPLTYHLPYARFYLEQGGLAVNETLRFPLHSHNLNLLYAVALMRPHTVESPALAQLLHAAMGWLSLLGIYGAARAWRSWPTALLAVLAVLLLDEFVFSFSAAFVDNGVMLFVTGAFLAVALWQERGGKGWLWLAAILVGSAMGTKYLGAWFTVPLGLWVLWHSRSLGLAIRFALLVSATGLFWYLRSWWLAGNPVHPFAGEIFGYSIWTAYDLQEQVRELAGHGLEKTWQNLLLLPWKLFTDWHRFNGAIGNAGWLVGAFMASCLLIPWQRPVLRATHIVCLAYLVFWFFTSQVIRYLMILLPLISLCTVVLWADVLDGLGSKALRGTRIRKSSQRVGNLQFMALVSTVSVVFFLSAQRGYRELLWYPLTLERQQQHLLQSQPAYVVAQAARADGRIGSGPVFQFNVQEIRWFFPGQVYGDWMGKYPYREFGHIAASQHWEINPGEVLVEQLVGIGVTGVVFSREPGIEFSPQSLDSYLKQFEIIHESGSVVLMVPRQERLIAEEWD
ncbi:MAG TPA: hypothetical protein VFG52_10795 [Xanthomonadales bacterium]|nr:hypothetical protein [Xanthomonadales bacterium]